MKDWKPLFKLNATHAEKGAFKMFSTRYKIKNNYNFSHFFLLVN